MKGFCDWNGFPKGHFTNLCRYLYETVFLTKSNLNEAYREYLNWNFHQFLLVVFRMNPDMSNVSEIGFEKRRSIGAVLRGETSRWSSEGCTSMKRRRSIRENKK